MTQHPNQQDLIVGKRKFGLTVVWQLSVPGVSQHTHSPGGGGAHEHLTHQFGILGNMHGDVGGVQRLLLAGECAPVDLVVDFLEEDGGW